MDLIQLTVARGTWIVPDGYGHVLPSKVIADGSDQRDRPNTMIPFFLSLSLIVKCPDDVHDEVAKLFRALRRLKYASDAKYRAGLESDGPMARPLAPPTQAKPAHASKDDRRKKIDQLLKELTAEVQKLDGPDSAGSENLNP